MRMIAHKHVVTIGKTIRHLSRLRGGSGSAVPGLIVEKIDPDFSAKVLSGIPRGVVVISGTNGKTTTTKIVCSLLQAHGLKVFTNKTGSNFTRGIIASLIQEVDTSGQLDADIAVLELDEAYAVHFVKRLRPRYTLLLNVMRDQLDRFGEIDHTASLLARVAESSTDGVVLNRDDPLLSTLLSTPPDSVDVRMFGVAPALYSLFPTDQQLHGTDTPSQKPIVTRPGDITLAKLHNQSAWFLFGNAKAALRADLQLQGIHNMQNAAGALCLARMILGEDCSPASLLKALANVKPAFGRGEALTVDGYPFEIVLVKNPAGFRLALESYRHNPTPTMIAINDNYADGRDMSWLWDVDLSQFSKVEMVSGIRAYDMALRLQYDDVEVGTVTEAIPRALDEFLRRSPSPKRVFCTYTAMMQLRRILEKRYKLEAIDI